MVSAQDPTCLQEGNLEPEAMAPGLMTTWSQDARTFEEVVALLSQEEQAGIAGVCSEGPVQRRDRDTVEL